MSQNTRSHVSESFQFPTFLPGGGGGGGGGGAYSHTLLLEGCVALQNAMIAAQAYFTSATHLVQIDHTPFTFLIITLAHQ